MRQWRKRLLWGVLLLGGLYSIAWWGAAAWLQEQLTSPHRIGLLQAHCRQPAVTGFPFAMQVTCPTVQVDTPVAALNTGALEVQGSAWAPTQIADFMSSGDIGLGCRSSPARNRRTVSMIPL